MYRSTGTPRLLLGEDSDIVQVRFVQWSCGGARVGKILRCFSVLAFVLLASADATRAQMGPEEAGSEWQAWTGGGHGLNGSTSGTGVWNVGLRYGLILTAPHGPGFLQGQLEYALDAVPVWVITQRTNTAYGAGVNPFAFKWILSKPQKVKPFLEIEGGTLFTNTKVPELTSQINFTTSAALGMHVLGEKHDWTAEVRFMHISNAGLATPNPGINTIQVRLGWGAFRK
ncbi:MAG: acyloxyacyl hydrolase [Candidatus Acidiferrum sp.]